MNPAGSVVDASVAMKWLVLEDFTTEARQLLRDNADGPFFAPPLLPGEIINALYQRQRRGHITAAEADTALV